MVINRLGYDNVSTTGLISKHGFMKLISRSGRLEIVSFDLLDLRGAAIAATLSTSKVT